MYQGHKTGGLLHQTLYLDTYLLYCNARCYVMPHFLSQIKTPWGKMIALRMMNVFLGHTHFLNSKRFFSLGPRINRC